LLQTDNHTSTPPLCFLQAGCPSCRPTNSVKALKATKQNYNVSEKIQSADFLPARVTTQAMRNESVLKSIIINSFF